uniref:hypothetical protein n=1 Tax=Pappia fissilis TaxID=1040649 RepID=UPI002A81430F|nr:hypothetical protein UYP79_mgp046 [Pappia fissilis]WOX61290.1 hypothetical protein [Pappia fissilis]
MMFRNPIHFLARLLVQQSVRILNYPTAFVSIINALFKVSTVLLGSLGIVRVLRVLFVLKYVITSLNTTRISALSETIINRIKDLLPTYSIEVIEKIINILPDSDWRVCTDNSYKFNKIFNFIFLPLLIIKSLRTVVPLVKWTFRFTSGIVLSAVGILFNETLYSIEVLKDFSQWVLESLNKISLFDFNRVGIIQEELKNKIPSIYYKGDSVIPVLSEEPHLEKDLDNAGGTLAIIGLILVGIVGVTTVLIISDYYFPNQIDNIPIVNSYVDSIYSVWHNLFGSNPDAGTTGSNPPEAITRSSSGSSDSTLRAINGTTDSTPVTPRSNTPMPTVMLSADATRNE